MADSNRLALLLSVDDLRPAAGGDVDFTLTARNFNLPISLGTTLIGDIEIKVELSDGLEFKPLDEWSNTPDPDKFIPSGRSATWLPADMESSMPEEITIETRLTPDSLDDIPLEERCITAWVEDSSPPPNPYYALGRLTQCLGDDPLVLFESGKTQLFTVYPCVGVSTHPCSSTDGIEMVVKGEEIARAAGIGRDDPIMAPGNVVVQVKDPRGRVAAGSNLSWGSAEAGLSTSIDNSRLSSTDWTHFLWEIASVQLPPGGNLSIHPDANRSGTFLHTGTRLQHPSSVLTAMPAGLKIAFPTYIKFESLGTYIIDFTQKNTHSNGSNYSATGRYTFHVGPVAELEASAAWQTPEGLAVAAVNHGPDHSLGARAVLNMDPRQSCEFGGVFQDEEELRAVGRPTTRVCIIPNAQLTDAQLAGEQRIGYIENHVEYTVCIDSSGDDVLPKPANRNDCEGPTNNPTGNSWHVGNVYDYDDSNNDIYLTAPQPALSLSSQRKTVTHLVIRWQRQDILFESLVSYYEVERLGADQWGLLARVRQPAPGENPEYEDTDQDRGSSPRYRVRAVNDEGLAGPWWELGGSQPGVVLALDKTTIKEPEDPNTLTEASVATVTATLNGDVSGQDITIAVSAEPDDPSAFTLSENRNLVIPAGQRDSTGIVTIIAKPDGDGDNEEIRITAVASYDRGNISPLTLTIDDDDDPGLTLNPYTLMVTEDDQAGGTYTVKLDAAPSGDVTVTLTSNNTDVTVDPASLTFTANNWQTTQTVTVRADADNDAANDTATITHRTSGPSGYGNLTATATITVDDIDTPAVIVEADSDLTVMEDGRTSVQYLVKLDTEPSGSVYITATGSEAEADAVTISPASFTLTRSNWERGQTVTVQARADQDADYETVKITHAIDAGRTSADEYDGLSIPNVRVDVQDSQAAADYDMDDNGLLEITTREQLNALRWDLDGDGLADDPANVQTYARAFPRMMEGSCGASFDPSMLEGDPNIDRDVEGMHCDGYELMNDITLSGNWTPIGGNLRFDDYDTLLEEYSGEFDGNGYTIRNLRINGRNRKEVGLFGAISGAIRNVGLPNVNVEGQNNVGALVGRNNGGRIEHAWSTGQVSGNTFTGGLVGWNRGTVAQSYSEANVSGWNASDSGGPLWSTRIAGLVGANHGTIENSYARGRARGRGHVAGLAGENGGGATIRNSYATGAVSTEDDFPFKGGLVGWQQNDNGVVNSYWDTQTSGQDDAVAQGSDSGAVGKTTAELQGPTSNTDIYANWTDTREDREGNIIDMWNFRTASEYPCLGGVGSCPAIMAPQMNRRASVTVTAANPVALNEGGSEATYTVVLDGQPTGNVTIAMSSDNGDVTTQPSQLTFTPDNWQTAQTVTVSAAQDGDAADDTATISHQVSGADGYAGIAVASVSVSVADDDTAGVTVTPTELSLNEGESAAYTVVLDTRPVGNVLISVFASGVTAQPTELTFTPDNWQTAQTVTVSAAQDDNTEDETAYINHGVGAGPDSGYSGVLVPHVTVSIIDDDENTAQPAQQEEPGSVTVSESSLSPREGDDTGASYTVVLDVEPTENVVITVSSDNSDVTVEPVSLTFTPDNWQTPQGVTVTASQDEDQDDDAATITHTASGGNYDDITVASVSVSVTDFTIPAPEPSTEPGSVTVSLSSLFPREGDTGAPYAVKLDAQPTGNVTITVSSDNSDVTPEPASLTFTPDNWQTEQFVTVSASEDNDETDDLATISHQASGGNYDGVAVDSVIVAVTDDDTDGEVLRDFYHATNGQSWTNNANWLSDDRPLGGWHGVTVNGQGQVTAIVLDGNNLTGSLPAELGKLQSLTRLALNRNKLTGEIPSELGSLPSLSIIGLARNQLSGTLPTSLGNLSGLTRLSLHDNTGLSGALPAGIGAMPGLTRLAVSRTGLSGELPQGLVNSAMQYLHFDDTNLCAPSDEAFQTWFNIVPDKSGPTCE